LGQDLHAIAFGGEGGRPAVPQIAKTRDLSLQADSATEGKSNGDRVEVPLRVRADLLVLANVGGVLRDRPHEGPQTGNLVATHVEEPGADGRERPLVQGRPVV